MFRGGISFSWASVFFPALLFFGVCFTGAGDVKKILFLFLLLSSFPASATWALGKYCAPGMGGCPDGPWIYIPFYIGDASCNDPLSCLPGGPGGPTLPDGSPVPPGYDPYAAPPAPPVPLAAPTWGAALAAAAAALGMGLLAGVGGIVGAPVLAAVGASAAVHLAIAAALFLPSGAATPQAVVDAVKPPVKVFLVSDPTSAPVPSTVPSAVFNELQGKFLPGAGPGNWTPQASAPGNYDYTPAPTVENPSPKPTAQIKDGGRTIAQQVASTSSGTSYKSIIVTRHPDGTIDVTGSAKVPVSAPSGEPSTLEAATTSRYSSATSTSSSDPIVHVSDTLGNGQSSGAGSGLTYSNSGPGTGPTAGPGAGTGGGGCTSGDCATETTQIANKGLLQGIKDALTGKGTASDDPNAKTGSDIGNSLHTAYDGPLAGIKGWKLPAHTSQCPSGTFTIPNSSHVFSFDGHCLFAAQNLPLLSSIFLVLWNLSALWIVIRL